MERARFTAWLSLLTEIKECDCNLEVFEIMPHEIGKYQNVLGIILVLSSFALTRLKKALIVCYFMKLLNEKQEYVRSFKDCWNTVA